MVSSPLANAKAPRLHLTLHASPYPRFNVSGDGPGIFLSPLFLSQSILSPLSPLSLLWGQRGLSNEPKLRFVFMAPIRNRKAAPHGYSSSEASTAAVTRAMNYTLVQQLNAQHRARNSRTLYDTPHERRRASPLEEGVTAKPGNVTENGTCRRLWHSTTMAEGFGRRVPRCSFRLSCSTSQQSSARPPGSRKGKRPFSFLVVAAIRSVRLRVPHPVDEKAYPRCRPLHNRCNAQFHSDSTKLNY